MKYLAAIELLYLGYIYLIVRNRVGSKIKRYLMKYLQVVSVYTRYDYTNAITIGTIISGVLVTVAALTIDVKPIYS